MRINFLSIIILFFTFNVYAESTLNRYTRNCFEFNKTYPQEKVYLHMDNRSYFIGDTIWFKAYVMNATTLHPTQMSGVLYVELLNEFGVEVEHKKIRMENGMCHGNFILEDDYRTGYYEMRAYTRYMLNWGNDYSDVSLGNIITSVTEGQVAVGTLYPDTDLRSLPEYEENTSPIQYANLPHDELIKVSNLVVPAPNFYIFSRVFPVYTRPEHPGEYKKEMEHYPYHTKLVLPQETNYELRQDNLELKFFPEGGALVAGVPSLVAFEATDQWGRKCEVEGYITEGKKNVITNFKTTSRGRGVFPLCPTDGKKYHAHISFKGKEYSFELPEVELTGCVLRLRPPMVGGDMTFQILCPADMPSEPLAWILQCRGALTDYDTLSSRANTTFVVPKENLKTGVNQLTVFDSKGNVLADRLFFVCPPSEPTILTASQLPDSLQPYEKVDLKFQLQNASGWPTQGLFSLSITDAKEFDHDTYDTRDIRSELLLTSDIKGFVEDVDSYFQHTSGNAMVADIDMLMRIQGWRHHKYNREWRRYNWHVMSGVEPFDYKYPPEKGLGIDGYIISEDISLCKGPLYSSYAYPRIPNLKVKVSVNANGANINETTFADTTASYSIPFSTIFYGEVPMTITLEDTLSNNSRKQKKQSRLTNTQIVINRAFSPKPLPYNHYQHKSPSEDIWFDMPASSDAYSAEQNLQEVKIKKRRTRNWEIDYERPELIIDYNKEWNYTIDRGTPWANGRRIIGYKHNDEYRMNFPWLTYSLGRLGAKSSATIKDNPIFSQYDQENHPFYYAYVMPKTIKVYSNLLGREHIMKNKESGGYILYYLDVEHFKKSESPKHAPYLSKHGIRDTFYEGYSRSCEFYERDYSDCALPDTADYRRTLHWDPDIWTDNLGRASVTFYNNKQTKKLHIRVEGFTRNGEFIVYDSDKDDN